VAIDDERVAYIQFVPRAGSCRMHTRMAAPCLVGLRTSGRVPNMR